MANDRLRRLMQESLDEVLSQEEREELDKTLERDPRSTAEFNRLQKVDEVLRSAPHERAPQRLAATIMARLATSLKTELSAEAETSPELEISREMIAIAISLVTVATMPMLVAASTLILQSAANPELLDVVIEQVIGLMLLVLEVLQVFLERAEELAASDPELAAALLTLMPIALIGIARYLLDEEGEEEDKL